MTEPDPKIIVDDDWKTQVEKEKEQLQQQIDHPDDEQPTLPPASFSMLVTTLSTQAMATLGFLPDPATGQPSQNLAMSKHFIDTLGVLESKTKGNLTDEEAGLLTETLHQLRMAYLSVSQSPASATPADDHSESSPSIELP